jgi:hypothetical protein
VKSHGRSGLKFIAGPPGDGGEGKSIILLNGFQVSPARPSTGSVSVKS